MKLAVFSDVHANLPALEAVYQHIMKQQPDAIYCLGDLVNQNVWNNEVITFIRSHHIPSVQGNHDEGIGNKKSNYSFAHGSREEIKWGLESIAYTLQHVTEENKKILKNLPLYIRLNAANQFGKASILLTHGGPSDNKERIYEFMHQEHFIKIMDKANADILLIGNTHCSFHKIICQTDSGITTYKHVINPGSVGYPKDGSWHASYALISLHQEKDWQHDPEAIHVDFFRIDYDINKVIKAIQHSQIPIYYAGRLLKY